MYKLTRLSSKNKNLPSTSLFSWVSWSHSLPILSDSSFPFNPVQSSGLHFHCSTKISLTKFTSDFYVAKCQGHFRSSLNAAIGKTLPLLTISWDSPSLVCFFMFLFHFVWFQCLFLFCFLQCYLSFTFVNSSFDFHPNTGSFLVSFFCPLLFSIGKFHPLSWF